MRFEGFTSPTIAKQDASEASAKEGCCRMHYVYLPRSLSAKTKRYVGLCSDLSDDG